MGASRVSERPGGLLSLLTTAGEDEAKHRCDDERLELLLSISLLP